MYVFCFREYVAYNFLSNVMVDISTVIYKFMAIAVFTETSENVQHLYTS
jgi:hypothetical protein